MRIKRRKKLIKILNQKTGRIVFVGRFANAWKHACSYVQVSQDKYVLMPVAA